MQDMEQQNKTDFLGIQQIAATLGLSKHSIYKLCQAGELAHYKVGGSIRVRVEDLNNYLDMCRHGGTKGAS